MQWYYAEDGRSVGPVSEAELQQLVRTGKITPSTLVWHEGLPEWRPYRSTAPEGAPPPILTHCSVCQKEFAKSEMVRLADAWVCAGCKPLFVQAMKEGVALPSASTIWRSGDTLVMAKTSTLPDRCVKCNAPAHGMRLPRNLYWHPPAYYLLILPGILIYAIVAACVRQNAKISVGLCDTHRSQRKTAILVSWLLVGASLLLFILAGVLGSGWPALAGIVSFLGGVVYGATKPRVVTPTRIGKELIWLKGICPEYLNSFPERH